MIGYQQGKQAHKTTEEIPMALDSQALALVSANVYLLLVFIDFIRRDDNSCCAVGSAIFAAAMGVFNFAMQFAIIINGQ